MYSRYLESENGEKFRNKMRKTPDNKLYVKYYIFPVFTASKSKIYVFEFHIKVEFILITKIRSVN
jgi:hypothetical protein